ncbi:MAG: glycosyltransferase [Marinilabiliaceae bacterium]|nr:glycosyltransferase [Marinilabiliaceae bacterium]
MAYKISIIIPVYNAASCLERCVYSILNQTVNDFEIILVDDGSTDGSAELCDNLAASHNCIRTIHQHNSGPSKARNAGLDIAIGDRILFIDADDWVEPTHIAPFVDSKNDNYDAIFTFWTIENQIGTIAPNMNFAPVEWSDTAIFLQQYNASYYFGMTWAQCFRRSLIEENHLRFAEDMQSREDELFVFSYCLHAKKLKLIPAATYHYCITQNDEKHLSQKVQSVETEWQLTSRVDSIARLLSPKQEWQKFLDAKLFYHLDYIIRLNIIKHHRINDGNFYIQKAEELRLKCNLKAYPRGFQRPTIDSIMTKLRYGHRNYCITRIVVILTDYPLYKAKQLVKRLISLVR